MCQIQIWDSRGNFAHFGPSRTVASKDTYPSATQYPSTNSVKLGL